MLRTHGRGVARRLFNGGWSPAVSMASLGSTSTVAPSPSYCYWPSTGRRFTGTRSREVFVDRSTAEQVRVDRATTEGVNAPAASSTFRVERSTASTSDDASPPSSAADEQQTNRGTTSGRINADDPSANHQPGEDVGQNGAYDPWKVLGLQPGAPSHEIRVRYHHLMQLYHPSYADEETADIDKWTEVDRAYTLITTAPTLDKSFRNLVSDTQRMYYRIFPEWIARNIDDGPRWWTWLRWKLPPMSFIATALAVSWIVGRITFYFPLAGPIVVASIAADWLFRTQMTMLVVMFLVVRFWMTSSKGDIAWLMSPKGFLQQDLTY